MQSSKRHIDKYDTVHLGKNGTVTEQIFNYIAPYFTINHLFPASNGETSPKHLFHLLVKPSYFHLSSQKLSFPHPKKLLDFTHVDFRREHPHKFIKLCSKRFNTKSRHKIKMGIPFMSENTHSSINISYYIYAALALATIALNASG